MASHRYEGVKYFKQSFKDMTTYCRRAERVKGYHLHLTDIKSVISNIVLVMPDIGSYINQNCAKSKSATLTRHMEKSIVPKLGSIPLPES